MASLFQSYSNPSNGHRLTGFPRFTEILDRDFKRLMATNFLTLIGFLPLIAGVAVSVLSSSILLLIPSCIIGGAIAGCALSGMYDTIFRILRDAPGGILENYKHALKQNWKHSILPGIIFFSLLGFYVFMGALFVWAETLPSIGTILVYLLGLLLLFAIMSIFWAQLVLFEQSTKQRLINCILFSLRYFWKVLGCTVLKAAYWVFFALMMPWSFVLLPLIGFWLILLITNFILYSSFDDAFHIEDQIAEQFPEQAPYYEDDAAWAKRKQEENSRG